MVYLNYEKQDDERGNEVDNWRLEDKSTVFSDQLTYQGTSKGVTRERHSTSHKVIFVDNLPSYYCKNEFVELFRRFGEILDVKFLKHKTGAETGYGFIEFAVEDSGKRAIAELHWTVLDNRNIRVSRAKPSVDKLSGTNLYVENIPLNWTNDILESYFSKICEVTSARVLINRKNDESQGVGFVHCLSHEDARTALLWFSKEGREKSGLALNVKFAKIPRTQRKAQKGQKVVDKLRKDKSKHSPEDVRELKAESSKAGDVYPEVGNEVSASQLEPNSSKYIFQNQLKSREKLLELTSSSNTRSPRNSKWMKRKKWKNSEKRRMKRTRKKGKHLPYTNKTEGYTKHLDTYAYQPQLLRSPFRHNMKPNKPKFLNPSEREYVPDQHHNTQMPCSPQHFNLSQKHEQKVENLKLSPTLMRSDVNLKDFNNSDHQPCVCSLPSPCKYHHIPFSPTCGYHHLTDSCTPATSQWGGQPMMLAPNNNASTPFSWTYMNYVASPNPDYQDTVGSVGWSSQLVSPSGTMEKQVCGCTNNLAQSKMEYRKYTNLHSQNWNVHANNMPCSASQGIDQISNVQSNRKDQLLGNGSSFNSDNWTCYEGQMQSCHSKYGYSESTLGQKTYGNQGTGVFRPTTVKSPQQGVNNQRYLWPGPPFNTHPLSFQRVPQQFHQDQAWSSASSCSGITSLNGEQSQSSCQIYTQEMMGYLTGKSQSVEKTISKVYQSEPPNLFQSLSSQQQRNKVSTNKTGSKFDKKSKEKKEQESQSFESRNVSRRHAPRASREKYINIASHHKRSNQVRGMSPTSASTSPQIAVWPGIGSQFGTPVLNPQCVVPIPKQYQYWSATSSCSAQNDDQPPSKSESMKLEQQHFVLGNFPVDVTFRTGVEPSELTGFYDDNEVTKRKTSLPHKFLTRE